MKWSIALLVILVSGCATPEPILKLADQGAGTVGLAEASLREYVQLSAAQLDARMDIVRQQTKVRARDRANRELILLQAENAGKPDPDSAAKLIRRLAEERRSAREKAFEEQQQIDQDLEFDQSALPTIPADQLAKTRKSFSVLAQELSPEEWITLTVGYVNEIADTVKELNKPQQPAPAPTP